MHLHLKGKYLCKNIKDKPEINISKYLSTEMRTYVTHVLNQSQITILFSTPI